MCVREVGVGDTVTQDGVLDDLLSRMDVGDLTET